MESLKVADDLVLGRMGYGAMQLAGPGVWGPPRDRDEAVAVLREAVELGVNHIDTSDYYGPHVTNEIIREALHPYPEALRIVTKVGARRLPDTSWVPAFTPAELTSAVHDNLRNLGVEVLDVVNLRALSHEVDLAEGFGTLAGLQEEGLVRHLGVSNVTAAQLAQAREIAPVVCVQNEYNLANRGDDALVDACAADGVAFVPFFPLGGFSPLQSDALAACARAVDATPMQVALAWLLQRSPTILLIPGTSSLAHLRENMAAAALQLPDEVVAELDAIG